MLGLRLPELLVILVVVALVFGPKKLPQLGDSLGKGIRAFKKATEHGFAEEDASATAPKAQPEKLTQGAATTAPSSAGAEKVSRGGNPSA